MQDDYAETYSKNQNIKNESVKRNERIKIIDQEIDSWKNLLNNSEKMSIELNERKNKQNLKLNELEKQPQTQAEKKGQISENLRISEKEKNENEHLIEEIDAKIINTQTLIKGSAPVAKIAGIPAYNNKLDILFNHAVLVIIFCLLIRGG